jgi:GNAT superfamily N-acetyltransferase
VPDEPDSPHIRRAQARDARAIAETHTEGWRTAYAELMPAEFLAGLDIERRATFWGEQIATLPEDARPWVAEDDRRIVGFVHSGPSRDDDAPPGAGEVYLIYVRHESSWRGIGRLLLTYAERDLTTRGHEIGLLWVLDANEPARRFYERQGWHADGATKTRNFGGRELVELRYRIALDKSRAAASS